jgi:photosynthetic reaction center H subunit
MEIGSITGHIDAAQVVLYVFWGFFFLLIFYLHQEGKREGYPLVDDKSNERPKQPPFVIGSKIFKMDDGSTIDMMARAPDDRPIAAKPFAPHPGAPLVPTGDPMADGVGPASFAERMDIPDAAIDGSPKLKPMRLKADFHVMEGDPDPRGMTVVGCDGESGGTVNEIWIDSGEYMIRYLELETSAGNRLLPITQCVVDGKRDKVFVNAIRGDQFAGVPATKNPDQVTRLEEDKICGYYGGGHLYATPDRSEPLV